MIKNKEWMVKMVNYRIIIYLMSQIRVFLRINWYLLCLRFKKHRLKLALNQMKIIMEHKKPF